MQDAIENLITKSSEMGASIERASIFGAILEKMNEAIMSEDVKSMKLLQEILDEIASRTTSNTTSDTTSKEDN
jgi:hypothetical protein